MNQNKQTERDQLTGFRTAEAVEKAFDKYLQEAADKEESLSVAIIDLDNFRTFNEKHGYGHENYDKTSKESKYQKKLPKKGLSSP